MNDAKRLTRRKALGLGLSGAAAAAAGGVFGYNVLARPRPKNVIFLVCDALRADRLGCYGYRRRIGGATESLTPNIDRLADEGLVFERCLAPSSWTLPSVSAYMASRLPLVEGERYNDGFVPPGSLTCAEVLAARDYQTIAVVRNPYLYLPNEAGKRDNVPSRGFRRYITGRVGLVDNPLYEQGIGARQVFKGFSNARETTEEALGLLSQLRRWREPFFLYLHYMDTHEPYNPPEEFKQAVCAVPPHDIIPDYILYQAIRANEKERGDEAVADDEMPLFERARECYDAAVRFLDEWVGHLVAYLRVSGLWDSTLLVFSSDHGEEFAERGWIGHSTTLYEESLHVPLIFAGRGVARGARAYAPARSIDIVPTILRSCEAAPPATMVGKPLSLAGADDASPPRAVCALVRPTGPAPLTEKKYSVIDPRGLKLILSEYLGERAGEPARRELYDLRTDKLERKNLCQTNPQAAAVLEQELNRLKDTARGTAGKALTVDEETQRLLKSLGYLQ